VKKIVRTLPVFFFIYCGFKKTVENHRINSKPIVTAISFFPPLSVLGLLKLQHFYGKNFLPEASLTEG